MPDAPAGDVPPATNDKPLPPAAPGTPEPIGTGWTEIFPVYRMDQPPGQVRHTVENIDGQRRGSFQDHGSATHYFKCGLYHQPGMTPRCDAWFKNIRIFKK